MSEIQRYQKVALSCNFDLAGLPLRGSFLCEELKQQVDFGELYYGSRVFMDSRRGYNIGATEVLPLTGVD